MKKMTGPEMTETSKLFTIDNGDKQFKAKLWLEERNVCFQVLEQSGELDPTCFVGICHSPDLYESQVEVRGENNRFDFDVIYRCFTSDNPNADRNEYYTKACGWLQEFCDVNGKIEKFEKFEYADVSKIFGNNFMYKDEDKSCESVFYRGMAQDNFAGIEYEGHPNEWFTDRIVMLNGQPRISTTTLFESDAKQAIPTRIRFFKAIK